VDVDLDSCTDVGDADSQLNMMLTQEAITMGTKSRTLSSWEIFRVMRWSY
jgi:hypothetical protein